MTTMDSTPVVIDGSQGEGGGQILRSALALSAVTGRPFVLDRIRAGRKKPGLMRQHLTCVTAAAALCNAEVHGAALSSMTLRFHPRAIVGGDFRFAIGSAGSTALVLQTVLPIAMQAPTPVTIVVDGGTHVPFAPIVDFLQRCFVPVLATLGAAVSVRCERHGFYPAGGGQVTMTVTPPATPLSPLSLLSRGDLKRLTVFGVSADANREAVEHTLHELKRRIVSAMDGRHDVRDGQQTVRSIGPGQCVWVELEATGVTELCSAIAERGESPKQVARRLADDVTAHLRSGAPVGEHLADQLLLPMALGSGGTFVTPPPTEHSRTNAAVIRAFLPGVTTDFVARGDGTWTVVVDVAAADDAALDAGGA